MSSPIIVGLQGVPTTWGVPPVGKTMLGINEAGNLVLKQNDGSITTIVSSAPGFVEVVNPSGTSTITATSSVMTAILDVTGTARAVPVVLAVAGAAAGTRLSLRVNLPAAAGLAIQLRNATSGGTLLDSFTSDGSILSVVWELYFDGGSWNILSAQAPAN